MHKASTAVISDLLEIGAESNNTSFVDVRVGNPSPRREAYGSLERREIPRSFIARFHTKYQQSEGCWLWLAGKFPRGYGMVNLGRFVDGRQHTEYAHRVAYVLAKGTVPDGCVVMHSCDVPACVNPAHLSLGTQGDNIRDAFAKGRHPKTRNAKSHRIGSARGGANRRSANAAKRMPFLS